MGRSLLLPLPPFRSRVTGRPLKLNGRLTANGWGTCVGESSCLGEFTVGGKKEEVWFTHSHGNSLSCLDYDSLLHIWPQPHYFAAVIYINKNYPLTLKCTDAAKYVIMCCCSSQKDTLYIVKHIKHNRMNRIQFLCQRIHATNLACWAMIYFTRWFDACGGKNTRSNRRNWSAFTRVKKEHGQEATHTNLKKAKNLQLI